MGRKRTSAASDAKFSALLAQARDDPYSAGATAALSQILNGANFATTRAAAELLRDHLLHENAGDAISALESLLQKPWEADPGCLAKFALAEALYQLEAGSPELWRRVIRFVQHEPVWNGHVDTAADLRGVAALALVATGDATAPFDVVELLCDREPAARAGAARALGQAGTMAAELVLRHKALASDAEPAVIAQVLDALACAAPERSVDFIAQFLSDTNDQVVEGAAVALARTRDPRAFSLLSEQWESVAGTMDRRPLASGIALWRTPESYELLLNSLRLDPPAVACGVLVTLRIYSADEQRTGEVRAAVESRGNHELMRKFEQEFG